MKTIFLFILFAMSLYAQDYTLKLYEEILGALSKNFPIVVYADKQNSQILQKSKRFKVVHFCNADVEFLLGSYFKNLSNICKKKPLFATTHRAYTKNNNAFGAFYWTKGRPQIHFNKKTVERFHIRLPENLQRFENE